MTFAKPTAAVVAVLLCAGCGTATHNAQPTSTAATTFTTAAVEDVNTAAQARQQIEDLQASWLPYVADVTFRSGRLTVALQIDRAADAELAGAVAKAVATNMRLGDPVLGRTVQGVDVTDGAGSFITQAPVATGYN